MALIICIVFIISLLYPNGESVDFCDDVNEWGFHCKTCETMVNCIQLPTGIWQELPIGECDNSSNVFCNRKTKSCSKKADCLIDTPIAFECNVEGTFPDPYDCSKYHVCASEAGILKMLNMKCLDTEFGYSTITKECSLNRKTSNFCKKGQFKCKKSGDMAPWPENPQIFYVCVQNKVLNDIILYPKFFECKNGESFNGQECLKNNTITTKAPLTSTEHGDGNQPSTDNPIIGSCQKEGLFRNPNDCKKYYICSKNLIRKDVTCPNHTHFDDHIKACILGAKCS